MAILGTGISKNYCMETTTKDIWALPLRIWEIQSVHQNHKVTVWVHTRGSTGVTSASDKRLRTTLELATS